VGLVIDLDKEINLPLCENFREGEHVEGHLKPGQERVNYWSSLATGPRFVRLGDVTA
jgi:hypothetical protein